MNKLEDKPLDILSEDATVLMPAAPQRKAPVRAPSKKARRFAIGLSVYAVCLVLAVTAGLWLINSALARYQAATPTEVLDQYTTWVQDKNYQAIYESSGFEETLLNDKDAYLEYLARIYGGEPHAVTLREQLSADPSARLYTVCFDDVPVSDILLSSEEGEWSVSTRLTYEEPYVLYAAPEMTVTVNGDDLALLGVAAIPAQETVFADTAEDLYPTVSRYTLEGLLNPPQILAFTLDGAPCTVVADPEDTHTLYVSYTPDEAAAAAQTELVKTVTTAYTKFIARDGKRRELLTYIYENSQFYRQISEYDNSEFPRHTAYELGDIQIVNSLRFTDTDLTCEVTLQPTYTDRGETVSSDPLHYRLTFLKIEDDWLLTSLKNVAQDTTSSSDTDTITQTEESQ